MAGFALKELFTAEAHSVHDLDLLRTIEVCAARGSRVRLARTRDSSSPTYYALKIVRKSALCFARLDQLRASLHVLSRLHCAFAIAFFNFFQDDDHLYYLTQFLPSGDLFSLLRALKTLPPLVAHFYVIELTVALLSIQKHNVLLRTLTPEGISLSAEGHIRLCDLDVSKVVVGRTYTMCGTPEYLAVEVVRGTGYGLGADWWAIGVLLFEMLSGSTPFAGDSCYQVYRRVEARRLTFPRHFARAERGLVKSLLAEEPSRLGVRGGEEALKAHPFYKGVDWFAAERQLLVPPLRPRAVPSGDASNYDWFPEESAASEPALALTAEQRLGFASLDLVIGRNLT